MADKFEKRWINDRKKVESILKNYIKEHNVSLNDNISEDLIYDCRLRIANILHISYRESRHWVLICYENMQYNITHSINK